MKKSNIILLIIILLAPIALLAHHLSIWSLYKSGNFGANGYTPEPLTETIKLPPFKNLVVNGAWAETASSPKFEEMHVTVLITEGIDPYLTIRKDLQALVKMNVRNDSLFVRFESDGQSRQPLKDGDVRIQSPKVYNIAVDSARLHFAMINQKTPLSLTLNNLGNVKLDWLEAPFIYVLANNTKLNIDYGEIGVLRYTALKGGDVTTNINMKIAKLEKNSQ